MPLPVLLVLALQTGVLGSAPQADRSWLGRYDVDHPTRVMRLSRALLEISGLASWDSAHLVAHNDERATLFLVRTDDGSIVREVQLGNRRRKGDFEDIELEGRHGFLAESNGSLLEFTLDDTSTVIPYQRHPAVLDGICEVESLALDVNSPGLVVACKRVHGIRNAGGLTLLRWQRHRSYDLRPFISVPWAALGSGGDRERFAASGMVRTPDRKEWLLVDGPNARIAELSASGQVIAVQQLPKQLLPQAEGITFGVDGTLFVSSEGHHGPAVLVAYSRR